MEKFIHRRLALHPENVGSNPTFATTVLEEGIEDVGIF